MNRRECQIALRSFGLLCMQLKLSLFILPHVQCLLQNSCTSGSVSWQCLWQRIAKKQNKTVSFDCVYHFHAAIYIYIFSPPFFEKCLAFLHSTKKKKQFPWQYREQRDLGTHNLQISTHHHVVNCEIALRF